MWRGRWATILAAALILVATSYSTPSRAAESLTAEQMLAKADAVVARAQQLYDQALAALAKAQASGDPSAIADANNVLTTVKGVLKKAERDRLALKEALAAGTLEDARSIFEGILVADEALNAVDSALASIGGTGDFSELGGGDLTDTSTDGSQPTLDTDSPFAEYTNQYDSSTDDRSGYDGDPGTLTQDPTGVGSTCDDLCEGSPTGGALD